MKFFKVFLITICLTFFAASIWSTEFNATIQEVSGKVEMRKAGGPWTPVVVGDVLNAGDSISTGFNSKAVMILGDSSILVANDLTRLTIAELFEREGTVVTDLFLNVGNIRTEVHSSDTLANDFTVRNANSTASVRGTVLDVEILGNGEGLKVRAWEGMAQVSDIRSGRLAYVGEPKKDGNKGTSPNAVEDFGLPSEPSAAIAAAPLLASGSGGIVSSMASMIASSTVNVSTKPPALGTISISGGGSALVDAAAVAVTAIMENPNMQTVASLLSNINIEIVWSE